MINKEMKNKKTILLFVFDGMADWEPSYALVGIIKSKAFQVRTIAIDKSPIKTMGGLIILPDLDFLPESDLDDLEKSNTAMLILPGGDAWEGEKNLAITDLVRHCVAHQIPVAAICGATLFLARLGILDNIEHTSNDLGYLQEMVPDYEGASFYRRNPSVVANGIVTASGTAAIEFASDIFDVLGIAENDDVKSWFDYFQNKMVGC